MRFCIKPELPCPCNSREIYMTKSVRGDRRFHKRRDLCTCPYRCCKGGIA